MDQLIPVPRQRVVERQRRWPPRCRWRRVGDGDGEADGRAGRHRGGVSRLRDGEARGLDHDGGTGRPRWGVGGTGRGRVQVAAGRGGGGGARDVDTDRAPGPGCRSCTTRSGIHRPGDGAGARSAVAGEMDQLIPGPPGSGSLSVTPVATRCRCGRVGDGDGEADGRAGDTGVASAVFVMVSPGPGPRWWHWPTHWGRWWHWPWPCSGSCRPRRWCGARDVTLTEPPGPGCRSCTRGSGIPPPR